MDTPMWKLRDIARGLIRMKRLHRELTEVADQLDYRFNAISGLVDHMEKEVNKQSGRVCTDHEVIQQWINQLRSTIQRTT